jgi:FkbM family methyltransferase
LVPTPIKLIINSHCRKACNIHFLQKYAIAASTPAFWPALVKGVMPAVEHIKALDCLHVKSVIDVGANRGQFALLVRNLFPQAEVHAFEPLESERRFFELVVDPSVKLYPVALGAQAGQSSFYVTSRPDSSSLLRPGECQAVANGVVHASSQTVTVAQLDNALDVSALPRPILMKLDVQGGELDALKGAMGSLPLIDSIYTEVSFVPFYDGQPLAGEITAFLEQNGFILRGVFNHWWAPGFGPGGADLLFVKPSLQLKCVTAGMRGVRSELQDDRKPRHAA